MTCILLLLKGEGTLSSAWAKPGEALKTSVPALLYLVQNNLQYVAVGYLDAATYTVSYQSKIIWSGMLSVLLLGRRLGPHKWLGITLLAGGVAAGANRRQQTSGTIGRRGRRGQGCWFGSHHPRRHGLGIGRCLLRENSQGCKSGPLDAEFTVSLLLRTGGLRQARVVAAGEALRAGRTSFFYGYTR